MQKIAEAVVQVLNTIGEYSGFVSKRKAPTRDLKLEVKDVGLIRFPVTTRTAKKLCDAGHPARHGYKDQTRLDRQVRDTWEISRRRLVIDEERWLETLTPALERIHDDLGLPDGCTLKAQLHNLLVYGPGQFFKPHQDSEKEEGMIATLVVSLPSQFSGGEMVIEHHGEKEVVKGSIKDLTFIAFYADCHHEVREVTEGYRVVLTYNLILTGVPTIGQLPEDTLDSLTARVKDFFETPVPPRYSHDDTPPVPPDRLVYLLDYQYTEHSLAWNQLKGGDALTAAALQEAARRLDCQLYLALADVHETWDCVDTYDRRDRYRGRWRDDDEDEDTGGDDSLPELTDLINSEIQLRHFVGVGRPPQAFKSGVASEELCFTVPSIDMPPFRSEHEGYMGNWGNTVDHWYHRSAVVLWPKDRGFVVQAKASPRWALDEISRKLESRKAASEALPLARRLLAIWPGLRYLSETKEAMAEAIAVATKLGDPEVATGLLQHYSLSDMSPKAAAGVASLLTTYGLDWFQGILQAWRGDDHPRSRHNDLSPEWLATTLTPLCRALCSCDTGQAPARALLLAQWPSLQTHITGLLKATPAKSIATAMAEPGKALVALLESAQIVEDKGLPRQVLSHLTGDADLLPLQLAVLRTASKSRSALHALNLAPVHARALRTLIQLLSVPEQPTDDWSITSPTRCTCERCKVLKRFLTSKTQVELEWPIPENDRFHIENIISNEDLPVRCSLLKKGRPYSLQLEKTSELFKRAHAQRRSREQDLTWLKGIAKAL